MFILWNIPEQKYFADIKPVTVTADSPDLSDSVTELAYSMQYSECGAFVPRQYLMQLIGSNERILGNIPEQILGDQIITFIKDSKSHASCECFTLILRPHSCLMLTCY